MEPPADHDHARRRRGLLRQSRDYQKFFAGASVSKFGDYVTTFTLPLVALRDLHAGAFEVGVLAAASTTPLLLFGLVAGVLVDRRRRRPILLTADGVRLVAIGSIPVAQALGVLSLVQLFAAAFIAGTATVFANVANVSYLPSIVAVDRLPEANAQLQVANETADFGGPLVAGWLIALIGGAYVLGIDAATFVWSAITLLAIVHREPPREPTVHPPVGHEILESVRHVWSQTTLRLIALNGFFMNCSAAALGVAQPILIVRALGISTGVYGLLVAIGSIGGVVGGLAAIPIIRRVGLLPAARFSTLATAPFALAMTFVGRGWLIVLYAAALTLMSACTSVVSVAGVTYRQTQCPPQMYGRLSATMRFIMWAGIPLGGLLAGAVAAGIDPRAALWTFALLMIAASLPMLALGRTRESATASV